MKISNSFRLSPTKRIRAQRAASMFEYALLIMLIALIAVPAVGVLGNSVSGKFDQVSTSVPGEGNICNPQNPDFPDC